MTTDNPFEDIEKAIAEAIERQLEIVRELDSMEVEVTAWEADFLQNVLTQLNEKKKPLTQGQLEVLHRMCNTYEINYGDFFDDRPPRK